MPKADEQDRIFAGWAGTVRLACLPASGGGACAVEEAGGTMVEEDSVQAGERAE